MNTTKTPALALTAKRGLQHLIVIRRLLASRWSPGSLAYSVDQTHLHSVHLASPKPCYFSIGGAVQHVVRDPRVSVHVMGTIRAACIALYGCSAVVWEDLLGRTVEEVLALIDFAILAMKSPHHAGLLMYADHEKLNNLTANRSAQWIRDESASRLVLRAA